MSSTHPNPECEPADKSIESATAKITADSTSTVALDKLTLELLMNKRQYRKYVEKHDPDEYAKKQTEFDRFAKYRPRISRLLGELLEDYSPSGNSEHLGNLDVQDTFQALLNSCIYFFETRDYDNRESESTDDTMFFPDQMKERETREATPESVLFSAPFANHYRPGNSFWGKNVAKRA